MKKLKKSVKIILVSVISAICVLGIVLGCVLLNKKDPTNPPGIPERVYSWSEKVDALKSEVNINTPTNSYDIILGTPYEEYLVGNTSLYEIKDNYFIISDSENNLDYYHYYMNAENKFVCTKINDYKENGGFVENGASSYDVEKFDGTYAVVYSLISKTEYSYSVIDLTSDEPAEIYCYKYKSQDDKVTSILNHIEFSSNKEYAFFTINATISETNSIVTPYLVDLKNSKEYKVDEFNCTDETTIQCFIADNSLTILNENKISIYVLDNDKLISGSFDKSENQVFSGVKKITPVQYLVSLYQFDSENNLKSNSYYSADNKKYMSWNYKVFKLNSNAVSVSDFAVSNNARVWVDSVSDNFNFYRIIEQKIDANRNLVEEKTVSYYFLDNKVFFSTTFVGENTMTDILRFTDDSVLMKLGLVKIAENMPTEKLFTFGTENNILPTTSIHNDIIPYVVVNNENAKIMFIDMKGELLFDGTNLSYGENKQRIALNGFYTNGENYLVSNIDGKLYSFDNETFELSLVDGFYAKDENIKNLLNQKVDCYFTYINRAYSVNNFANEALIDEDILGFEYIETKNGNRLVKLELADKFVILNIHENLQGFNGKGSSTIENEENENDSSNYAFTNHLYINYYYPGGSYGWHEWATVWIHASKGVFDWSYIKNNASYTNVEAYGWKFKGWATSSSSTAGVSYTSSNSLSSGESSKTYNLYSVFERSITQSKIVESNGWTYYDTACYQRLVYTSRTAFDTDAYSLTYWTFKGFRKDDATPTSHTYSGNDSYKPGYTTQPGSYISAIYTRTATLKYNGNSSFGIQPTTGSVGDQSKTIYASAWVANISSTTLHTNADSSNFRKNGYNFIGWRLDNAGTLYGAGGSVSPFTSSNALGSNSTFTYWAQWEGKVLSATLNDNNGSGSSPTPIYYRYNSDGYYTNNTLTSSTFTSITKPTRIGYTYAGHYYNGTQYINSSGTIINSLYKAHYNSITLTASWTANTYTIAFAANKPDTAGTVSISSSITAKYDTANIISAPSLDGYTFTGWTISGMTDSSSTGHTCYHYYGDSASSNTSTTSSSITTKTKKVWYKNLRCISGTVTFTANWEKNPYTIYFNANTPTNATNTVSLATTSMAVKYDENSAAFPTPTLTGWTCKGWAKKASATTKDYSCNSQYKNLVKSGSITLYAVWQANTYTIVLAEATYLSGHTASTGTQLSGTSFTATYDTEGTFKVNAKNVGYHFSSWKKTNGGDSSLKGYKIEPTANNDNDSTKAVTVTTKVKNLATSGTVTLTVDWAAITYTIKLDTNKPTKASSVPSVTPTQVTATYNADVSLPTPQLDGWTATGWSKTSSGTKDFNLGNNTKPNLTTTKGATITIYALYTQNNYKIVYDVNKPNTATNTPTVSPTNQSAVYEEYYTVPKPTLTGWACTGWSTSKNGSVEYNCNGSYRNFTTVANGTITLYAIWAENAYYITYNSNKPAGASASVTGSVADTIAYYDSSVTLATNTYVVTGWTCEGWSRNKTTKEYNSGATLSKPNFTSTENGTITLYAIWSANKYTIILDGDGNTIKSATSLTDALKNGTPAYRFTATYDITGSFSATLVKLGYMFNGWEISTSTGIANAVPASTKYATLTAYYDINTDTGKDISTTTTTLNLSTVPNGTVTLKAKWKPITYYVYLSIAYTTGSTKPSLTIPTDTVLTDDISQANGIYTATYGSAGKFKVLMNRVGYLFKDWTKSSSKGTVTATRDSVTDTSTSSTVTTEVTSLTTIYKDSVTLTANWEAITYYVQLARDGGTLTHKSTPTISGLKVTSSTEPLKYEAKFDQSGTFYISAQKDGYMFGSWTIGTGLGTATSKPTNANYSTFQNYYSTNPNTVNEVDVTSTILNVSKVSGGTTQLTVKWTPITYNLIYNGGKPTTSGNAYPVSSTYSPTGSTPKSTASYGTNSTFSSNGFSLVGWTFIGWARKIQSTYEYLGGSKTTTPLNLSKVNGDNVNIYAVWRQNNYKINYILNGGEKIEGKNYPIDVKFDSWFIVSVPTRTGYTFKTYTISTFTTDHEKWYGPVGVAESRIEMSDPDVTTNQKDDSGNFVDYRYKNLISTDGGEINFEADWTANTYYIEYDFTNGKASPSGTYPTTATYDTAFSVSAPERLGYTFTAWNITRMDTVCTHYYGSNSTTSDKINSTNATTFKNLRSDNKGSTKVLFTAIWTKNKYKIEYKNVVSTVGYPSELTYDEDGIIANPTKIGYTFISWTITEMSNTCTHYYGTSATTYQDTTVTSITLTKEYTYFKNLHSETTANGGKVVFTANWNPNIYKINYVLGTTGGALGEGKFPSSATFDVPVEISAPEIAPFGYHFDGWEITGMSNDCTHYYSDTNSNYKTTPNTSYVVPATTRWYMNLHSEMNKVVTLTAIWSPNVYKVKYILKDLKGGNGRFTTTYYETATYDSPLTVPYPVRTGYTFTGWSLSQLSDECTHYHGSSNTPFESTNGGYFNPKNPNEYIVLKENKFMNLHYENGEEVVLTANWVANPYTITYHYIPSNYNTTTLTPDQLNYTGYMTATRTQNVIYDSNFTTMKNSYSNSDPYGIKPPKDVSILHWIFYKTESSSYQVATISGDKNEIVTVAHSQKLDPGFEYIYNSNDIWGEDYYELFGDNVHAYAVYGYVNIQLKFFYADTIVDTNNFACYKEDTTLARGIVGTGDVLLPTHIDGRAVLGFWISSNYYVDGEITTGSISKYKLNGTEYEAIAGRTIPWGYSTDQAQDPENPVFYLYAIYDNSFQKLYTTTITNTSSTKTVNIDTSNVFVSGEKYKITIRGPESKNFYDFDYIKLGNSSSTGFNIENHKDSTSSTLTNFNAVAQSQTTMVITFTANSSCSGYWLYLIYPSTADLTSTYLNEVEIIIEHVVERK